MKKIIKYMLLFVVCFIPFVGNAKGNFELKAELENKILIEEKNGNYTFINGNYEMDQAGSIVVYNSKGEKVEEASLVPEGEEDFETIMKSPYMIKYFTFIYDIDNYPTVTIDDKMYAIDYYDEEISYASDDGESITINFEDDLDETRRILGKRYDVYTNVKQYEVNVDNIKQYDNYFVVYYYDDEDNYVSIMNGANKIIKTFSGWEASKHVYYVYDNLIYIMDANKSIEIYKNDGTLYQTYNIESDLISEEADCDGLYPVKLQVINDMLFISYVPKECPTKIISNDIKDLVNVEGPSTVFLTLVYDLEYEIDTVESSNGKFTYESKVDENGRSYVELNISPEKGYYAEKIIVTDASGNTIEVKDNKFYMPLNDVKIEVKFSSGEYLPIPDTALNSDLTIIIIGIVLISLGAYTIKFIKKESK